MWQSQWEVLFGEATLHLSFSLSCGLRALSSGSGRRVDWAVPNQESRGSGEIRFDAFPTLPDGRISLFTRNGALKGPTVVRQGWIT